MAKKKSAKKTATKKSAKKKSAAELAAEKVPTPEVSQEDSASTPPADPPTPEVVVTAPTPPTPPEEESPELSEASKAFAVRTLESYYGVGEVNDKLITKVSEAILSGLQVLICEGKGNKRFDVKVVNAEFALFDPSKDVKTSCSLVNLTRLMADAKRHPES